MTRTIACCGLALGLWCGGPLAAQEFASADVEPEWLDLPHDYGLPAYAELMQQPPRLPVGIENPAVNRFGLSESVLHREQAACEQIHLPRLRAFTNDNTWLNGVVPYTFNANTTTSQQNVALTMMREIERIARITFTPRGNQQNYVEFTDAGFNASFVGPIGGKQEIWIFNWNFQYIVGHEIYHALGMQHEQSRPDRNSFVEIDFERLYELGFCSGCDRSCVDTNFELRADDRPIGLYDYDSVMHYSPTAFACGETVIRKVANPPEGLFVDDPNIPMGNVGRLSPGDKAGLLDLYGESPICVLESAIGFAQMPSIATDLVVRGATAYVTDSTGGLFVLDVTNPYIPKVVGNLDTVGRAMAVAVDGTLGVVADAEAGMHVIDLSAQANPRWLATVPTESSTQGVALEDGMAFMADGEGGIVAVSLADPASPVVLDRYETESIASDVEVRDGVVYATDWSAGLLLLDVTTPDAITLINTVDTPGQAFSLALDGGTAAVADNFGGVQLIDVTSVATPGLFRTIGSQGGVRRVDLKGDRLCFNDLNTGLEIVDLSRPLNDASVATYNSPGRATGVAIGTGMIFLLDDRIGLEVIPLDASCDAQTGCAADLNADGVSDLTDIRVYVELYLSGSLRADRNSDGLLDLTDTRVFANQFLAGCEDDS